MLLQEAQTDWLASKNIFYNTRTKQISDNINDLIDPAHIRFHAEGLRNYLDYGYSVFGQTPVEEIHILPPNCKIYINNANELKIEKNQDPLEHVLGNKSTVKDTEEYIHGIINEWAEEKESRIIVPTSGGFDSRFINCMIDKKDRIHAYTYGISEKQGDSWEAVYAQKLCEILGISWKQIELGDFNLWIDDWYKCYGVSTHAHGMYHMEFYDAIRKRETDSCRVVSGIYGDLWAGNWKFPDISKSSDLVSLSIAHGMKADSGYCKLQGNHDLRDSFFEENRERLQDDNWKIIFAGRMKIVLISYLLRVPEYYGFETWSPFVDFGAVSRMINLDWREKERRKWQVEYFRKNNVLIGELGLPCDGSNTLNQVACLRQTPKPLDVKILGTLIEEDYVEKINANLTNMDPDKLKYYYRYLTLYPIQRLLYLKEYGKEQESCKRKKEF